MTRAVHPSVLDRLRDAMRAVDADCALAFAEAVVAQVAHPLGAAGEHRADDTALRARQRAVADAVVTLAGATPVIDAPALHADVTFLSACFQNMDLLPAHGCPAGDRIALRVADAIARLPHDAAHDAP